MTPLRPVRGDAARVVADLRGWLDDADPAPLVIETSGSTGRPKRVVLSRAAVVASAEASAARLGGGGRWVLTLPPSYVAGVNVVVRSLLAGAEPVVAGESLAAALAEAGGGALVSLVPTQLHRALADPDDAAALRDCHAVLLGGGPIDPLLRERAESQGVPVVATYGSSETSGGCVYDGLPLDGVDVVIDDDNRIRLAGPMLFDRYDGDDELTRATLVDGWFLTSDLGRLHADGRLEVLGRVDDVVISGGVNVPTGVVARRLRSHPSVRAVEVLGVPDPEWGHRVVAVVEGWISREEAREWVADVCPRTWAPTEVVLTDGLPLLPNGKVDRQRLLRECGGDA